MGYLKYFLFSILYFYISNWFQIKTFIKHLFHPKRSIEVIHDEYISSLIKRETGLSLKRILVFKSEKMFGMMPGIPIKPELILSSRILEDLNKDELEWVILHESAHCLFWHVPKTILIQLSVWVIGLLILKFLSNIVLIILLSTGLSLLVIRFMRVLEWQADKFAINKVSNPEGVISAQEKFKKVNSKLSFYQKGIFRQLLFWNILPVERVKLAEQRIQRMALKK